jgi:hypothetical protein
MKVNYTTANGRLSVELEAEGHSSLWKQLAAFQEVFEETACGKCKSENLKFVVRTAKDSSGKKEYTYHELHCKDCRAKLHFGVIDDGKGSLFPKRKQDGKWVGSSGWVLYNKETQKEE